MPFWGKEERERLTEAETVKRLTAACRPCPLPFSCSEFRPHGVRRAVSGGGEGPVTSAALAQAPDAQPLCVLSGLAGRSGLYQL